MAQSIMEVEYQWPPVSSARMRAGLRSALKTECSSFRYQNGGRNLRWFRAHRSRPQHEQDRACLFWQGHVRLFEQSWGVVGPSGTGGEALLAALDCLVRIYQKQYGTRETATAGGADRPHVQCLLADGSVQRALHWAVSHQPNAVLPALANATSSVRCYALIALALEADWTWLLERWQAAVEASKVDGDDEWDAVLFAGAVQTGSLSVVEAHWSRSRRMHRGRLAAALGCGGSVEVFDWVVKNSRDVMGHLDDALNEACRFGHFALMQRLFAMVARAPTSVSGTRWLLFASTGGKLDMVQWLVRRGALPSSTCLVGAVRCGHISVVRFLHERAGQTASPTSLRNATHNLPYLLATEDALSTLAYLVAHLSYDLSLDELLWAFASASVRLDVLRVLATHVSQEVWDNACEVARSQGDLDVLDLFHAVGRGVGLTCPC